MAAVLVWLPVAEFQSHITWKVDPVADVAAAAAAGGNTAVNVFGCCILEPDLGHGCQPGMIGMTATGLIDDAESIRT